MARQIKAANNPIHEAELILKLYELRREAVMREARSYVGGAFLPLSADEFVQIVSAGDKHSSFVLQVYGYWDMVAAFVLHGALSADLVYATCQEMYFQYAKIQPYLGGFRETMDLPEFLTSVERVVDGSEKGRRRIEMMRKNLSAIAEVRAASGAFRIVAAPPQGDARCSPDTQIARRERTWLGYAVSITNVDSTQLKIIDCHLRFLDERVLRYSVFQQRSPELEALVGDYSALPRRYRPEDYLEDVRGFNVVKTVCPEFISDSPSKEVQWANALSKESGHPSGVIARADFMSPDIEHLLDEYICIERVRAVRQHLAWHPTNPLLRFAPGPDLMSDARWRKGVGLLRKHSLRCEIEIFAHQLPELVALASSCLDLQFILPMMGWPLDLTPAGYRAWKRDMTVLGACENVAVKIFGLECIFGLKWTIEQVRHWILDVIAIFGPTRCMFASHMPITTLACSFQELYSAYLEVLSGFSMSEKQQLFHHTAAVVYGV